MNLRTTGGKIFMNNFNFVHHHSESSSANSVNLDKVTAFSKKTSPWEEGEDLPSYIIEFECDNGRVYEWIWMFEEERDKIFNALLKLTSQNLCDDNTEI